MRFNRKVEISISMLQYLNCMGAVFSPVNFISRDVAEKDAKKGNMVGPILICGLLVLVAATIAGWSYLSLFTARDEKDSWQLKANSLSSVDAEYNELTAIETNYGTYKGVKIATDLNNNHFHALINDIEAVCPKSFKITTITSDGSKVSANCISNERLLSVSSLIIQLNKIPMIRNAWVETISEDQATTSNKFRYAYSLTFDFIANELNAAQEVTDTLNQALDGMGVSLDVNNAEGTGETPVADETAEGGDQ